MSDDYYYDPRISQSQLKLFLNPNPRALHRKKHDENDHVYYKKEKIYFSLGKLLDELLEGKDVNDYFYILPEDYKYPTPIVDSIAHQVFDATEPNETPNIEYIKEVIESHNYQPRWKEATKEKWIKETLLPIIDLKDMSRGLTLISHEDYELVAKMTNAILEGEYTKDLIQGGEFQVEVYTEEYKCLIDYLILDHENKTFRILDFKTTGDYLELFPKSILKFRYDIQMSFYKYLVQQKYPDYKALEPVLIAVSKKEPDYAEPFVLSHDVLHNAEVGFSKNGRDYLGWKNLLKIAKNYNGEMYNSELINTKINYIDEL